PHARHVPLRLPRISRQTSFLSLWIRRPPRSTASPTRRSSDLRGPRSRQREPTRYRSRGVTIACRACSGSGADLCFGKSTQTTFADRKSTRLNSSHVKISYAVFCLKKKKQHSITEKQQNQIVYI